MPRRGVPFASIKAKREQWVRDGLCYSCGAEAAEGHKLCEDHLLYHRQRKRELRAERRRSGLCIQCAVPVTGAACCKECYRAMHARQRKSAAYKRRKSARRARRAFYARRRRAGLCTRCGATAARPGMYLCHECTAAQVARAADERVDRRVWGLCKCGREPRDGFATCERCAERYRVQARRNRERRRQLGLCRSCDRRAHRGSEMCTVHRRLHVEGKRRLVKRRRALAAAAAVQGDSSC